MSLMAATEAAPSPCATPRPLRRLVAVFCKRARATVTVSKRRER
jgi:hypothetical protein